LVARSASIRVRVRDPMSGKWGRTRYKITDQTAHERYGEGNYEPIVHTWEVSSGYVPLAFGCLVEKLRAAVFVKAARTVAPAHRCRIYRRCRRAD